MLSRSALLVLVGAAAGAGLLGCTPPPIQNELGTPTLRHEGRTLVLLPRTCIVERSVPARHFATGPIDRAPTRTTGRLRDVLDTLVPGGAALADGRATEACSDVPDLGFRPDHLAEVQASEETMRLMRDRDADHVVVLEVHTVMACARRADVVSLAPNGGWVWSAGGTYQGRSFSTVGSPVLPRWTPDDLCLEDEITLTAYLFGSNGKALWAVTRDVTLGDDVGPAVDHVLARVPAAMPTRTVPGTPVQLAHATPPRPTSIIDEIEAQFPGGVDSTP